jgi:hypothetical protein
MPSGGGPVAALSLNLQSGASCPLTTGYDDVPAIPGGHPVTATGPVETVSDNTESPRGLVRVECRLVDGVFEGSVSIHDGQANMSLMVFLTDPIEGNFLYEMEADRTTYGGAAASPCVVTPMSLTTTGGLFKVTCPDFTAEDVSVGCVLADTYVYFEGCQTTR